MKGKESNVDRLLRAREELDEALRRYKADLTVLFTDVVGSTSFFDQHGDTAGLAMVHRHAELTTGTIAEFQGHVIKTIGDSVLADFAEAASAVRAAVELQRHLLRMNQSLAPNERFQIRIGIHSGLVFRSDGDVFGDVVNLAARITKRTGPAQILISRSVYETIGPQFEHPARWIGKVTVEGKSEGDDMYEVLWADEATYAEVRQRAAGAVRADAEVATVGVEQSTPFPALAGRYQILAEVGRGGMGVVYKAQERETGDVVALKVLKPDIASDASILERFKNEVRLARRITHKNVCRIYDFNRAEGTAYISMEFVEGESLRRVVSRFRTLSVRAGLKVARQICDGLREAHAQGIVHRDLKPENVMLDQAGNVKLMDFGMARWIQASSGQTGALVGTPSYMAPEQAEGKPIDHRADLYSFGLILYEIFTGTVAFRGDTPIEIALRQVRENATPPRALDSTLSPAVEKIILRCLEKDPAGRFQSVDELEVAVVEVQRSLGVEAGAADRTAPPASGLLSSLRIPRRIVAGAVALSALVAGLVLIQMWRQPPEPPPPIQTAIQPESLSPAVSQPQRAESPPPQSVSKPTKAAGPPPQAASKLPKAASQPPRTEPMPSQAASETPQPASQSPPSAQEPPPATPAATAGSEPMPAPEAKPASATGAASSAVQPGFYVQAGSFGKADQANALAEKLRDLGYSAIVVSKRSPTNLWFRAHNVLVGPHATSDLAQAQKAELESKGFKNTRLVQER